MSVQECRLNIDFKMNKKLYKIELQDGDYNHDTKYYIALSLKELGQILDDLNIIKIEVLPFGDLTEMF